MGPSGRVPSGQRSESEVGFAVEVEVAFVVVVVVRIPWSAAEGDE
jgi:hypothetical protein